MVNSISSHMPWSTAEPLSKILILSRHKKETSSGKGLTGKDRLNAIRTSAIVRNTKGIGRQIRNVLSCIEFDPLGVTSRKRSIKDPGNDQVCPSGRPGEYAKCRHKGKHGTDSCIFHISFSDVCEVVPP